MIEAFQSSNDQIFNILFNSDEITWQSMIYELVSSEMMDPWDVDVSLLAQKFMEKLKKLKEMDLKISGKVLLAAAMLLRIKSTRFMEEDISALDALINSAHDVPEEDNLLDGMDYGDENTDTPKEKPRIFPRTPQPRKRKVSVFDLVNALEKALEVYKRRPPRVRETVNVKAPEKPRDISLIIRDVFNKIIVYYKKKRDTLTFNALLPGQTKEDKVFTFIPLLHLDNQRKIDLSQEHQFGDIAIELIDKAAIEQ
jgi:segregation and condensation protein A